MKRLSLLGSLISGVVVAGLLSAQNYAPPASLKPDDAKLKAVAAKTSKLSDRLSQLRQKGVRDAQLVEVEIYLKAAEWMLRHGEYYLKGTDDWTLEALDAGLLRASQAAQGEFPWLTETGHSVVRAYRSIIDGSVQPYAVTFPASFGKEKGKKWRVDIVLHGRDSSISEVKFLHAHVGAKAAPQDQEFVQIDIYGRGNNAYRWAGETDVLEVQDNFFAVERLLGRDLFYDPARIVLRGFSMGGAGSWHLGLHLCDRWCVVGPGAGFTTTHGYIKNLPELPSYQEACLHIYDAVDYAENAANVPIVAYGGAEDPQLQASKNIEAKLKPLGIGMTLLIAPGEAHRMPPAWQKKAEEFYAKAAAKGREEYPSKIHFVTYTLRYAHCDWINLLGLEKHYERAVVDAGKGDAGYTLTTKNVRALSIDLPIGTPRHPVAVNIDKQKLEIRPYLNSVTGTMHIHLERQGGSWMPTLPERLLTELARRPQKVQGMQGPIDDAFTAPFLCVVGSGEGWHSATHDYARNNLKRFRAEWDKYMRGELQVKKDTEVTPEDIAAKHLILFGDPASNSLMATVLNGLPLTWTKDKIVLNGQSYSSAEHVPAMIYPSPLNPRRYVVLNSGHTFHAPEFQGTNALLYPRLGDYAVLKLAPTSKDPLAAEVATAGLFDDFWQYAKK